MADNNETLLALAKAQLALAQSIAHVIQAAHGQPEATDAPLAQLQPSKPRPPRKHRGGRQKSDLDEVVMQLLAERPGSSVAEIERALGQPGLARSRLEWSLRRLLESGRIEKSGNTCGARYSPADRSSSLRVVGS